MTRPKSSHLISLILLFFITFACEKTENMVKGQKRFEYIRSPEMRLLIPAFVFLPENYYADAANKNRKYPVIYLLHGYEGDHAQWSRIADLKALANQFETILVCPDVGKDSWYFDTFSDTVDVYYKTYIIKHVLKFIDRHYRTLGKQARAITGLSMGGHGALQFISQYPDSFVAAGSMSGVLDLRPFSLSWNIAKWLGPIERYPKRWHDNSVINMVKMLKGKNKGIIIQCGTEDFVLAVNRAYRDSARVHGVKISYFEEEGAHTIEYWKTHLADQLEFLSKYFILPEED